MISSATCFCCKQIDLSLWCFRIERKIILLFISQKWRSFVVYVTHTKKNCHPKKINRKKKIMLWKNNCNSFVYTCEMRRRWYIIATAPTRSRTAGPNFFLRQHLQEFKVVPTSRCEVSSFGIISSCCRRFKNYRCSFCCLLKKTDSILILRKGENLIMKNSP